MKEKVLTTGDLVEKFKGIISRSTISRYIDQGKLRGKKNPITGRRIVTLENLRAFKKKHGLK